MSKLFSIKHDNLNARTEYTILWIKFKTVNKNIVGESFSASKNIVKELEKLFVK